MKHLLLALFITLSMSCGSIPKGDNLFVYRLDISGNIGPSYLIIKGGVLKQCDLVCPLANSGFIGNYDNNKQDTLLFYAKYEYGSKSIDRIDSIPFTFVYDRKHDYYTQSIKDTIFNDWIIKREDIYKRLK